MQKQIKKVFFLTDMVLRSMMKVLIRFYQLIFSPDKSIFFRYWLAGRVCRHHPHCSQYGYECFDQYNFFTACFRTMDRISRCTPGITKTYDPVRYRVLFASGSPIGVPFLQALVADPRYDVVGVLTMPDMPSGRGMKMQENVIALTAKDGKIRDLKSNIDKIIVMHGKDTNSTEKWYPLFKQQIEEIGIPIYIPDLPNSSNPDVKEWIQVLSDLQPTSNTLLIGHSRGGVAILRALEQGIVGQVYKTILVATNGGYTDKMRAEEENKGFYTSYGYKFDIIKKHCPEFIVFHSTDDQWVPYQHGLENTKGLDAKLLSFNDKGHFGKNLTDSGFPGLVDEILEISNFIQKPHSLRLDSKKYADEAQDTYTWLQSLDIDILYVVAYGNLLPQHILDIPKIAPINIHGSLLPAYRGASPLQTVFLDGLSETGITLMKMEAGLDSGPMIDKQIFKLGFADTVADLIHRVKEYTPAWSLDSIDRYVHGELEEEVQDETLVTHCGKIEKEDGKIELTINNEQLTIKEDSLETIYRKYKAYYVWPKIYFQLTVKSGQLKVITIDELVLDESLFEQYKDKGLFIDNHYTLNSAVISLKVKPEGGKSMSWDDFQRGYIK